HPTPPSVEGSASATRQRARPFLVITELGEGGMARVHLAAAQGPGGVKKLVVLKALRAHLASEPACVEMFLHEARLATRLNHPNVVQTFEVTQSEGRQVIVMEYLDGQALSQLSARARQRAQRPLPLYLHVLCGALAGLHYAHELKDYDGTSLGLVHRDVSPQNIFVTYDGQVKLLDFGIAKAAVNAASHTETGVLKGKVRYMAPEQIVGDRLDRRADIFAVGAVLWEILAGERIWLGVPDMVLMQRVTSGDIPSPRTLNPDVPEPLERICLKALSLKPEDRFATAEELQVELEQALGALGANVKPRDLGSYVADLFAEERATIRETIESYVGGDGPSGGEFGETVRPMPGAEATPPAAVAEPPHPESKPRDSGRTGRLAIVIAVVVTTAFALVASVWAFRVPARENAPASSPQQPAAAPLAVASSPSASVPAQVRLSARVTPETAHLRLDGTELTSNPYEGIHARDSAAHELLCEAPGYMPQRVQIRLDRDVNVTIALERERLRTMKNQAPSRPALPVAGATSAAAPAPPPVARDCAQPYYFDSEGIKKIRAECL
ncbi:MAG: serine/threonine protein kinase, partial [Polyangiaceae bacterium]